MGSIRSRHWSDALSLFSFFGLCIVYKVSLCNIRMTALSPLLRTHTLPELSGYARCKRVASIRARHWSGAMHSKPWSHPRILSGLSLFCFVLFIFWCGEGLSPCVLQILCVCVCLSHIPAFHMEFDKMERACPTPLYSSIVGRKSLENHDTPSKEAIYARFSR